MTIAAGLTHAIDAAFVQADSNLEPFRAWSEALGAAGTAAPGPTGRVLRGIQTCALKAFALRFDGGLGGVLMLASWMQAREAVEHLTENDIGVGAEDALDALYDLAGLIESMEDQPDWPYLSDLHQELDETIGGWTKSLRWFIGDSIDPDDVLDEICDAYDIRDRIEWALNCLTFFKLEFTGRLEDLDVDSYRSQLIAPDKQFRDIVKKAKREGWHQADREAPKSFWWRH